MIDDNPLELLLLLLLLFVLSSKAKSAATSEGTTAGALGDELESIRKKRRLASGASEARRSHASKGPSACGLKEPPRNAAATGGAPHC